MLGCVALVLHAHLPYVRHPEHERSLEERWLYEAIWECYLPLLDLLDRLAADGVAAPLTVSVSPPLAAMLADELLRRRFEAHLARLERLAAREDARLAADASFGPVARFYRERLAGARASWERIGGDVLGALVAHHDAGRIELWTSSASHAYLPGLAASPAAVRAQLRIGIRAFERLSGRRPAGLWLPECAYEPSFGSDLARAGVGVTIVDAHGLDLASPRPPLGVHAPVLTPAGVAFFARDPDASREVWSRVLGYPGDPAYREFYRDVGHELSEAELDGEVGPFGTRVMTGLKYHRITGPGDEKAPYEPAAAAARAREHAKDFRARREAALAALPRGKNLAPIAVAPYDAELFGHWWFEGPLFLEALLRELDASARAGGVVATTPGRHLARYPDVVVAEPAASSWGEGGFGDVWTGEASARLWRHVHHAERRVRESVTRARRATGVPGRALDQSIRELLLLESSDWAFMIRRGEVAEYADARVRAHVHRSEKLAAIAMGGASEKDARWVDEICGRDRFLAELEGEELRDAFDPWPAE